jgi:integrase
MPRKSRTAGRAPNLASSIYLGSDNRWHGYVSMGRRSDGRPDRRHVQGPTEKAVLTKVRKLEQRRDAGTVTTAGKAPTVEQWLTHWLDTIAARKVEQSTWDGYESKIRIHLIPGLGAHRLDRLQPEHIEAFYVSCDALGLSTATVLQLHRILSRALKVAVQRGHITRNVCTLVDAPSLRRAEVEPLTQADARAILRTATGRRNAARWSVALAIGLRQGEALGLRWTDVDLVNGAVSIRQALRRARWQHGCGKTVCGKRAANCPQRSGGGLRTTTPKSQKSRRTIVLPTPLTEALRAHRAEQDTERMTAGELWTDHGLVFCQPTGRPIDPRADWGEWKTLLAAGGVRDARLHDARHTAATLLLVEGVPARVVMELLGHSQITLTLGTYSHVVPELKRTAADRMGAALWG